MWQQRDQWSFWNGDRVVELRRSLIEYRPIETHQHFILPYERQDEHRIAALEGDLREWDWIAERSSRVEEARRKDIVAQMRDAVSVAGTRLEILSERPPQTPFDPLASVENVCRYLFTISNSLRDMGADEAADKAFFTAIAFTPQNPIATEFLENARAVLHSLTRGGFARRREADLRQIPKVSAGIAKWLSR